MATAGQAEVGDERKRKQRQAGQASERVRWVEAAVAGREGEGAAEAKLSTGSDGAGGRGAIGRNLCWEEGGTGRRSSLGRSQAGQPGGWWERTRGSLQCRRGGLEGNLRMCSRHGTCSSTQKAGFKK